MAATFFRTETDLAYRVNVRDFATPAKHGDEACRIVLGLPDTELLSWRRVTVRLGPLELPGRPLRTVPCARCGEMVFDGKDVESAEGPMCRSCAHGPYYGEPAVEPE
jgi:formylmethanofuran dehydrogenase subunit E